VNFKKAAYKSNSFLKLSRLSSVLI